MSGDEKIMGVIAGPFTVIGGSKGARVVVRDITGEERLIRHIEPFETCEVYVTPVKRRK